MVVKWRGERVDKTVVETLRRNFVRMGAKDEFVKPAYKTNKIRAPVEGERL